MIPARFAGIALILALAGVPALQAQAAATDQKVLSAARGEQATVIESLHNMVNIESGSDDTQGLERMAKYVEARLHTLGASTELVPATNGRPPGLVKGTFKGNGKLRVMLIAHLDTVYHEGILKTEPWHRDGNKLYGPGIADDKGGIAVILGAIAVLDKIGWRDYARLTVLIDPDEEIGSPGSGAIIAKLGSENDVVLSYEPTPAKGIVPHPGVLLQAAGTALVRMEVKGRAAHAGAAPEQGRNALVELAYQILRTRDIAKTIPGMQMNWTTASAGTARNQIPEHAEASGDVRISDPEGADKLRAALAAKVAKNRLVPDTTTTVSLDLLRPMFKTDAKTLALGKLAQSVYAELDEGDLAEEKTREMPGGDFAFSGRNLMLIPDTTGGTDAGFAQSSGKAAVLEGLGLAGWGYHAKGEYIEIDSIIPRLYLSTRMLIELGKKADGNG